MFTDLKVLQNVHIGRPTNTMYPEWAA